jgi:hypothetical protein
MTYKEWLQKIFCYFNDNYPDEMSEVITRLKKEEQADESNIL